MNQDDPTATAGTPASAAEFRLAPRDCLAPRNAPLWLLLGLLRALVYLPFRWQMAIGRGLGWSLYHTMRGRRRIAAANIRLCFPHLDSDARRRMLREHFAALGMSVLETGIVWWRRPDWYLPRIRIEDREHLDRALARGHGVLLVTPHYTALELAGTGAAQKLGLCATYDEPRNPLIRKLLIGHRKRLIDVVLHNSDIRGMVRLLRANRVMFFAPDQTVRRHRGGIVAPFFGIPAVTSTGTSRLARMSRAPVVTMLLLRNPGNDGYTVRFLPMLEDFPSRDAHADTARVNEHLAEQIRHHSPAQYFWVHQRFKRGQSKHQRIPFAAAASRPPWGYRLASLALAGPLAIHTRLRAARDGGRIYRNQRRGRALDDLPRNAIWIHAASVGEVAAVIPLLTRLAERHASRLLLSTSTPTGRAVAEQRVPAGTTVCYLPVDRPAPVRRFVHQLQPCLALIMETELWPWLYATLEHAAVPIVIINGRLSGRTRNAPAWLRPALRFCLRRCRYILTRSDDDATAFARLGARRKYITAVGNLKFAAATRDPGEAVEWPRPHVVAASTHDDEEHQLARAWRRAGDRGVLLVIVPRHPERGDTIERTLAGEGLRVRRRSRNEPVDDETDVYLADTMGELPVLMARAKVVFIGGSLIPHGGQNLIEPARLGRPIVTGPYMDNFRDETASLEAAGGVIRTADAAAAVAAIDRLLDDPAQAAAMGRRAREAIAADADIAGRYLEALAPLLDEALARPGVSA